MSISLWSCSCDQYQPHSNDFNTQSPLPFKSAGSLIQLSALNTVLFILVACKNYRLLVGSLCNDSENWWITWGRKL